MRWKRRAIWTKFLRIAEFSRTPFHIIPNGKLIKTTMKPLQHAQISAITYGGVWSDYIDLHNFLDSSKAACAHFKHRFLLHHAEGIELAVRLFAEQKKNSEKQIVSTRRILTDHLIEDVGRIVSIEDWARDLMSQKDAP